MTEKAKASEMEEQEVEEEQEGQEQESSNSNSPEMGNEELDKMRAALKKANAEAAKYRKQAEAYVSKEQELREAEMTELERANKKVGELEAQIRLRDLNDKKREIAAKVGLPPALALRLAGETDEEIEEDALGLLESLPKQESTESEDNKQKPSQRLDLKNPNAATKRETAEEQRERLFPKAKNIFDPDFMKDHGGGVIAPSGE